jgi:aspartate racemase
MRFYRSIAIIGGLGPHAGAHALSALLHTAASGFGAVEDYEYPEVFLHSVPFKGSDQTGILDPAQILSQLRASLATVQSAGAQLALIACNSSHVLLPQLQASTSLEIVSLIDAARAALDAAPRGRFAVLSSASVRAAGLYRDILPPRAPPLIALSDAQQRRLDGLIGRCMPGAGSVALIEELHSLVRELARQGAEGILLGCTELSWAASLAPFPLPALDSLAAASHCILKRATQPLKFGSSV